MANISVAKVRLSLSLIPFIVCLPSLLGADSFVVKSEKFTVLGTLVDGDATGEGHAWLIQLNPVIIVRGRQVSSLEVKSTQPWKLASLEDKFIEATGKITISEMEVSARPFFKLSSIKEHKLTHSMGLLCRLSANCRRDHSQEKN